MALKANDYPDESPVDKNVKLFEQHIDGEISKNWASWNRSPLERLEIWLWTYFEQNETIEPQVLQRLKALYEQAGWKAEIVDKGAKALFGLGAFEHKYYIVISKR
jgi:hypothetical protein